MISIVGYQTPTVLGDADILFQLAIETSCSSTQLLLL